MNKIDGNEAAFANPGNRFSHDDVQPGTNGLSIKQLALKDFMCALASNPAYVEKYTVNDGYLYTIGIAEDAEALTNTYIDQLNKTS